MVDPHEEPCGDSAAPQGEAGSHAQGTAKTITQIVMEQLSDAVEIRYGSKLKVLWNKTSKAECQASMNEISQVVHDTLSRLRVDFRDQDLYMAFEAMDIKAWQTASETKMMALRQKARRLCDSLKLPYSGESWSQVVRHVVRTKRALDSTASETTDNRVLWFLAARACPANSTVTECMHTLEPLISF